MEFKFFSLFIDVVAHAGCSPQRMRQSPESAIQPGLYYAFILAVPASVAAIRSVGTGGSVCEICH